MLFVPWLSRFLPRALLILVCAALLSLAVLAVFLHNNPHALAEHIAKRIEQRTGMAWSMGGVAVALLPVPSLAMSDVSASGGSVEFSVAYVTLRPAILPLLRGEFEPGNVTLLRPRLRLRASADAAGGGAPPAERRQSAALPDVSRLFDMMNGCDVDILYGSLERESASGPPLRLEDVSVEALFSLSPRLRVKASGLLRRDGRPLPFAVSGGIAREDDGRFRISRFHLELDKDSLNMEGLLSLSGENAPRMEGGVNIQRLSLTQWFGFARRLPPGLRRSLDDIRGGLDFKADMRGLEATRIEAAAAGGNFAGRGGVARWAEPVVFLDLAAPELVLRDAFPEAEGESPVAPDFGHSPLTPEPGSPVVATFPGPDINYDIRLRADRLQAWKLPLEDVGFNCVPGDGGLVSMSFVGSVYGGKGEGNLLLRSTPSGPAYAVKARLKNIPAERLAAAWRVAWMPGGRLWLDTAFNSQGPDFAVFLASMEGTAALRLENGTLFPGKTEKDKFPFIRLSLEARAKSAGPAASGRIPDELVYGGLWKAAVETSQFKGELRAEGPLTFRTGRQPSVSLRDAPGRLSLWMDKETLGSGEPLNAEASGRFSLRGEQAALEVEDMRAAVWGVKLQGNALAEWSGRGAALKAGISAAASDARRALRAVSPELASAFPVGTLGAAYGAAEVSWGDDRLELSRMRITLDGTTYTGSCGRQRGRPARWEFDLSADALDLDKYIPSEAHGGGKSAPPAPPAPWKLRWMRENEARGTLRVDTLRLRKLTVRQARLPLRLEAGVLECADGRGVLYGGALAFHIRAEAGKGLRIESGLEAENVHLLPLSLDRGMKVALDGRGSFKFQARGVLFSRADMPAALSGSWRLRLTEARLQRRNAEAQPQGSPTILGLAQASGSMVKGVLHSDNLLIDGRGVRAAGGGWVDLAAQTLDVNMHMNMPGLPEFPVRFYGSLEEPQRSVNAGKAIVNALGSLGSGVIGLLGDVLGGVLGGALRLLP